MTYNAPVLQQCAFYHQRHVNLNGTYGWLHTDRKHDHFLARASPVPIPQNCPELHFATQLMKASTFPLSPEKGDSKLSLRNYFTNRSNSCVARFLCASWATCLFQASQSANVSTCSYFI